MSSFWRSAADSSWCTYRRNITYTSGGADCPAPDTFHLFSVLPFPSLPILWNDAILTGVTMEFHCIPQWYLLSFTCIFSMCCLQYASVLQAGIIFQAINWLLFFYIPEQKGGSKCDKTHSQQRIRSFCTFYACQDNYSLPLRHYSTTACYLLLCWLSIRARTGFEGNV